MALRRAGRALVLAAALGWAAGPLQAQAPVPWLSAIPVDATQAAGLGAGPALTVRVRAADAPGLARLLGQAGGPDRASGPVLLRLQAGTHAALDAAGDALAASFIVDHDDPAVAGLVSQLKAQRSEGSEPIDGADVVAFVARVMRSTYDANAHLASQVARSLQGDCTEHALLTAALARAVGVPARLVQGAVLVQTEGRWLAYGHAWVQTLESGRALVRDSALAGWNGPVYYLPALVMSDEGPGFRLELMRGFERMPSHVEIVAP